MPIEGHDVANHLTLVEVLEVTGPFDEFVDVVRAMVRRVEAEGVRELVRMQFHSTPGSTEVGVVITFSDSTRVLDHVNMVSAWEEFRAFARVVRLTDMQVFGTLHPEVEAWIRAFGTPRKKFERIVAGFARGPAAKQ